MIQVLLLVLCSAQRVKKQTFFCFCEKRCRCDDGMTLDEKGTLIISSKHLEMRPVL
jgi:hypothetical protein